MYLLFFFSIGVSQARGTLASSYRRRASDRSRAHRVSYISFSLSLPPSLSFSLSLRVMILVTSLRWNATIHRPIRVRYLRSRSEERVNRFSIINRESAARNCRRTSKCYSDSDGKKEKEWERERKIENERKRE